MFCYLNILEFDFMFIYSLFSLTQQPQSRTRYSRVHNDDWGQMELARLSRDEAMAMEADEEETVFDIGLTKRR